MDPERWTLVETIYDRVVSESPERWRHVLEDACAGDPDLRSELESLLDARDDAGGFLSEEMRDDILRLGAIAPVPSVGDRLGPYRLLAEAGAGGMGHVYRALDTRLEREVALKVLPSDASHDETRVAPFRQEAIAASALNHPNILTVHDLGEADGLSFIASEWIDGITVRERLSRGPVPVAETIDLARQCAAALAAAHRAGIVHRDIKPENIMIRPDGLVKIVDFGLARVAWVNGTGRPPSRGATHNSDIVGTPRYMSPEQARGETLDIRTDIFSLGAVLFEMTHGRAAFLGVTTSEIFDALLNTQPSISPGCVLGPILERALQQDRSQRYATIDEFGADLNAIALDRRPRQKVFWWGASVAATILFAVAALVFRSPRPPILSDTDSVLLADFVNETGDPVFDLTLKQGLAVQLEQSPRLGIFAEEDARATLRLMRQSPDQPLTAALAREICQRQGLKAFVGGTIAPLGSHYVISLTAADTQSGRALAHVQAEAAAKEDVLRALSRAASELREQLGESVASLRKFDALLNVTTSSLDALRAYSLARRERLKGNTADAIPFFRRALELDPTFAAAHYSLAVAFVNTRQPGLAADAAAKAYALREHASERERFAIIQEYYGRVTGEVDKRIETLRLHQTSYPRDSSAYSNLAVAYNTLGRFEESLPHARTAVQITPPASSKFAVLGNTLIRLGRFDEAADVYRQAASKGFDSPSFHQGLFRIAFVEDDQPAMTREVEWAVRKGLESNAAAWQNAAAAARGQFRRSRQFSRGILDSVNDAEADSSAAGLLAQAATRAAALERCGDVRMTTRQALSIERNPLSMTMSALALAWCGHAADAAALGDALIHEHPQDTVVNGIWMPVLRAAIALKRDDARRAVDGLQSVVKYEAAAEYWPQYLRARALLHLRKFTEAEAELRKILEHRGQDPISPLYPLARFELARAAALRGDAAQSRKLYQEFLADWKDADGDLPAVAEALRAVSGTAAGVE
jgi:serine/threonine protein kinase/tetratricopeptide (TPR) repeat protein